MKQTFMSNNGRKRTSQRFIDRSTVRGGIHAKDASRAQASTERLSYQAWERGSQTERSAEPVLSSARRKSSRSALPRRPP